MKRLAALAGLVLVACAPAPEAPPPAQALEQGWSALQLDVSPAPLSETEGVGARYGRLIFRGGVELKSANPLFGGWSGIEADEHGRFYAVSDQGAFMAGVLMLDDAGNLVGVSDPKIGVMRGRNGAPLEGKDEDDAEDIARLPDGRYAVAFEHGHRIDIYDLDGKGPIGGAEAGPPVPQEMGANEGIEALAVTKDGHLIAGREFAADYGATTQAFRLRVSGGAPAVGAATVDKNYGFVALRRLPSGDYLALERFYFPLVGNKMIFRLFPAAGAEANPPRLEGEAIALLEKPLILDNFEGLAVTRRNRVTRLYIISDNNFSPRNKTLIYAFDFAR